MHDALIAGMTYLALAGAIGTPPVPTTQAVKESFHDLIDPNKRDWERLLDLITDPQCNPTIASLVRKWLADHAREIPRELLEHRIESDKEHTEYLDIATTRGDPALAPTLKRIVDLTTKMENQNQLRQRYMAIRAIGATKGHSQTSYLVSKFESEPSSPSPHKMSLWNVSSYLTDTRKALADAISESDDLGPAEDRLAELLKRSDDAELRWLTCRILAKVGFHNAGTTESLLELLRSSVKTNPGFYDLAEAAVWALSAQPAEGTRQVLEHASQESTDAEFVTACLDALIGLDRGRLERLEQLTKGNPTLSQAMSEASKRYTVRAGRETSRAASDIKRRVKREDTKRKFMKKYGYDYPASRPAGPEPVSSRPELVAPPTNK